jgi:hypothetical protein
MYINGYTGPLISDHRLRYLTTQHGGRTALALARKSVTHVILASTVPAAATSSNDRADSRHDQRGTRSRRAYAGHSMAAGKLQHELALRHVSRIRFVTAAWVLESVAAGRRLPEARYGDWGVGRGVAQRSVRDVFGAATVTESEKRGIDDGGDGNGERGWEDGEKMTGWEDGAADWIS